MSYTPGDIHSGKELECTIRDDKCDSIPFMLVYKESEILVYCRSCLTNHLTSPGISVEEDSEKLKMYHISELKILQEKLNYLKVFAFHDWSNQLPAIWHDIHQARTVFLNYEKDHIICTECDRPAYSFLIHKEGGCCGLSFWYETLCLDCKKKMKCISPVQEYIIESDTILG